MYNVVVSKRKGIYKYTMYSDLTYLSVYIEVMYALLIVINFGVQNLKRNWKMLNVKGIECV